MHFLVIHRRFGTPIHVFLELDPREQDGFPELAVRQVDLDSSLPVGGEVPWRPAWACPRWARSAKAPGGPTGSRSSARTGRSRRRGTS